MADLSEVKEMVSQLGNNVSEITAFMGSIYSAKALAADTFSEVVMEASFLE